MNVLDAFAITKPLVAETVTSEYTRVIDHEGERILSDALFLVEAHATKEVIAAYMAGDFAEVGRLVCRAIDAERLELAARRARGGMGARQ